MRSLLPVALLLATAAAPAPPPVTALLADSEARWVPFTLTPGNQIKFQLSIDGRTAAAILDTGASRSVLSSDFAAAGGMTLRDGRAANTIGGTIGTWDTPVARIAFGGLVRQGGSLAVIAMPANATGEDRPVDALIGQDMVAGVAIDIDYAHRRFRLLPSGRLPFPGVVAPLLPVPGLNLYATETRIGAGRLRPVVLDTGDGAEMTLSSRAWRASGLPASAGTTAISFGLAGPLVTGLATVDAIAVGGLSAHDVEVRVEPETGYSSNIGVVGRIGNGLLSQYRLLLDPGAGRVVFSAASGAASPLPRSTSGIQAVAEPGRLRIVHVMRASPAEAAGWRAGETICSVDGHPIDADYGRSALARWTVAAPGRTVSIGFCGGEVRRLVLRKFY